METLLLIDDDKSLRYLLRESLEKNDFVVIEAMNGARSIEILKQHHVDAILLDLHLPDGYGVDLIPQIRELTNVPLIIVSGDQEKSCRIEGLDAGADDYVIKPFSTKELVARIKANLRRYHGLQKPGSKDASTNDNTSSIIKIGKWNLDQKKFQIFDDKNTAGNLTIREFLLLEALVKNANCAVNREDLGQAIKTENYVPTPHAIDVKITRLRKKLGDCATDPQIIKTIRGVGYMICL